MKRQVDIHKIMKILDSFFKNNQAPIVDFIKIQTGDPFKILLATILSARTNDLTTSKVVKRLFLKVKNFEELVLLSEEEIQELIYPVGFYRQKAKYLKKLPDIIKEKFGNKIPDEINDLIKLPGVGRKTANLVRALAFEKPAICVDIHVHRISNRWGYVKTKTPLETEMALREKLPQTYWINYNSFLVSFGQKLCMPRNPFCNDCPVFKYCNRVNVITKHNPSKESR